MYLITGIEIRCDLPGPPICSVLSMGTVMMNRNSLESTKRQTFLHLACMFPRSGQLGHLCISIYFGNKAGYRENCKLGEMYECHGAFRS